MTRERRFLVAGVGNAWLRDDGFGGEVGAPPGATGRCRATSP